MFDTAALPPPPALLVFGDHVHEFGRGTASRPPAAAAPEAGEAPFRDDPLDDLGGGR